MFTISYVNFRYTVLALCIMALLLLPVVALAQDNQAPAADDDEYWLKQNYEFDVGPPGVLIGDSDPDGDALTAVLDSGPNVGTLTLDPDGSFHYVPQMDFCGVVTFTYHASDGELDSNIATVTIYMCPPVTEDDLFTTPEGTALSIAAPGVLVNDSDPQGDALTAVLQRPIEYGTLTLYGDGGFDYVPPPDFCGRDYFLYSVVDSTGMLSDYTFGYAMVFIDVTCEDDPPVANDDSAMTDEDTPVMIDVAGNDSDPDGNLVPGSATATSDPLYGTLVNNGDGTFTYTPDENWYGMDGFSYQICDDSGLCDTATVSITVNAVNDAPACDAAAASPDTLWAPNHTMVEIEVVGVTDMEGDTIAITIDGITANEPENGTGDGNTEPDAEGIGTSTAWVRAERAGGGDARVYTIAFSAGDGNGGYCSGTVMVMVPHDQGQGRDTPGDPDPGAVVPDVPAPPVNLVPAAMPDHSNKGQAKANAQDKGEKNNNGKAKGKDKDKGKSK